MLERGLDSRMTALRMTSYSEYYDYLELNMERRNELQKLMQFLTVGETFFFRYHGHFESVAKNTLADLLQPPAKKSLQNMVCRLFHRGGALLDRHGNHGSHS